MALARPITQHQTSLSNGLKLIGEVNPRSHAVALGYFVKTGSRDEPAELSGVSHFLEHMVFKGTIKRSALEISFALGDLAAQANAYTSDEQTVYYAAVLPEYFTDLHDLLTDMVRPSLPKEDFDMEKKVILEEIALYQDRPHFYLFENAQRDFFAGHSAGNSILGTTQSVSAISRDAMMGYHKERYTPDNMTLVASGNFEWDSFVGLTQELAGDWKGKKIERDLQPFNPSIVEKVYKKSSILQSHVLLMGPGPAAGDPDRYAAGLLGMILGDSVGSRLYWSLIDSGLADSAGCDSDDKDGVGCFYAYASSTSAEFARVQEILRAEIEKPSPFTETELERAKNKLLSRVVLDGELPMGRLMALGAEWQYRAKLHRLEEEIESIKGVKLQEVQQSFEKYLSNGLSCFTLLPS